MLPEKGDGLRFELLRVFLKILGAVHQRFPDERIKMPRPGRSVSRGNQIVGFKLSQYSNVGIDRHGSQFPGLFVVLRVEPTVKTSHPNESGRMATVADSLSRIGATDATANGEQADSDKDEHNETNF